MTNVEWQSRVSELAAVELAQDKKQNSKIWYLLKKIDEEKKAQYDFEHRYGYCQNCMVLRNMSGYCDICGSVSIYKK